MISTNDPEYFAKLKELTIDYLAYKKTNKNQLTAEVVVDNEFADFLEKPDNNPIGRLISRDSIQKESSP